mgnify:CR=1 FL=1
MKKFLAAFMALAMTFSLAACGGEEDTPDSSTTPNETEEIVEQEEIDTNSPYLSEGEGDDLVKMDGVNHTIFRLPSSVTDNTVDALTYMFTVLAGSFQGSEDEVDDVDYILDKNIMEAYNESFSIINPNMDYLVTVVTGANENGLTIEGLDLETIDEFMQAMTASVEGTETTDDATVADEATDDATIANEPTDDTTVADVDSAVEESADSDATVSDTTEPADVTEPTDTTEPTADEDTPDGNEVAEDTSIAGGEETEDFVLGEVYASDDTKVIYNLTANISGTDTLGEPVDQQMAGYLAVVIKDGYMSCGIVLSKDTSSAPWAELFIKSLEIDPTNEGSYPSFEEVMSEGLGDLTYDDSLATEGTDGTDTTETTEETVPTDGTDTTVTDSTNETATTTGE